MLTKRNKYVEIQDYIEKEKRIFNFPLVNQTNNFEWKFWILLHTEED